MIGSRGWMMGGVFALLAGVAIACDDGDSDGAKDASTEVGRQPDGPTRLDGGVDGGSADGTVAPADADPEVNRIDPDAPVVEVSPMTGQIEL